MVRGCGRYWYAVSLQEELEARICMTAVAQLAQAAYVQAPRWRGTNLGGWLMLEPGPAYPLFVDWRQYANLPEDATVKDLEHEDEYSFCQALLEAGGPELRKQVFKEHRQRHYTEATFRKIKEAGLNAVRVPFGYWTVFGPSDNDPYEGPCLDVLDEAVRLAGEVGLQVLLDLHSCPGGENGQRPSGRCDSSWTWTKWRQEESLDVLSFVAERYRDCACVTGLQVCNEPAESIPLEKLCGYYENAIEVVRQAGMSAGQVAIVCPVFTQGRLSSVADYWHRRGNLFKYDNVAFDIHYYHCFSFVWGLLSHRQHLGMVEEHARQLALLPGAVVGEFSLARQSTFSDEEQVEFAGHQLRGYNHSTHGWFFWNWNDDPALHDWCMEKGAFEKGRLPCPLGPEETDAVLFPEW
eukprot:CAMPEP_0178386368 /NCGR_PEP_ID=MMETSP0689_2-20121128/8525_1 /TAXON_ID=160604 /ORGANISM="Amphidinium massartii, Strain CS-259" /LENGTH=407 /DNA_ID=CAMNT_0020006705 /DNA_START=14 /DNA_END=1234 /DNA_ORIENTATION=+